MEEQIKKIYEKQKNGRIRMIRNVLLIYAALICVVSIFKGNPFPHQETVLDRKSTRLNSSHAR